MKIIIYSFIYSSMILIQVHTSKTDWWKEYQKESESYSQLLSAQFQNRSQSLNPLKESDNIHLHLQLLDKNHKSKIKSLLIGEPCDPLDEIKDCAPNAHCDYYEDEAIYKCNCTHSYTATSDRKCLRTYGYYCTFDKDPCNTEEFLTCVDNRCECENSENYQYQISGQVCLSKVGGPCSTSSQAQDPKCIANAICLNSRCICNKGYIESLDGQCSLGLGMPCKAKGECNSELSLVCKDGFCSCREGIHVFDPESNSCLGLVGSKCCHNLEGEDCPGGINNGCVEGAFCKKTNRFIPGRCVCQTYNLEGDARTCVVNPTFGHGGNGKVY